MFSQDEKARAANGVTKLRRTRPARLRMTRSLAEKRAVGDGKGRKFDGVAFLRSLREMTFTRHSCGSLTNADGIRITSQPFSIFDREHGREVLWTPWQRVGGFHTFRQAERAGLIDTANPVR